jgi:hypothetical protein
MVFLPPASQLKTGFSLPTMLPIWQFPNSSVNLAVQSISALMCGPLLAIEHSLNILAIGSTKEGISRWLYLEWRYSRVLIQVSIRQLLAGRFFNGIILFEKLLT